MPALKLWPPSDAQIRRHKPGLGHRLHRQAEREQVGGAKSFVLFIKQPNRWHTQVSVFPFLVRAQRQAQQSANEWQTVVSTAAAAADVPSVSS